MPRNREYTLASFLEALRRADDDTLAAALDVVLSRMQQPARPPAVGVRIVDLRLDLEFES